MAFSELLGAADDVVKENSLDSSDFFGTPAGKINKTCVYRTENAVCPEDTTNHAASVLC